MSDIDERMSIGYMQDYELYIMLSIVVSNLVLIAFIRQTVMRRAGLHSLKGIDCIMLAYIAILSVFSLDLLLNIIVCKNSNMSEPMWARYLFYRL